MRREQGQRSAAAVVWTAIVLSAGISALAAGGFGDDGSNSAAGSDAAPEIVNVIAKSYEFIPNVIRVHKGARVQLRLRTADRPHGLVLDLYPEGTRKDGHPGLVFSQPQWNEKVEKDQERTIEFVAARAGTYDFRCSVQCGMLGHGRMKGKLIVED